MKVTTEPMSISVFTLNLRFGLADDGENRWEQRKNSLARLLKKFECDFMVFQEANVFQGRFIQQCLEEHEMIGERDPAPKFWQNNLIFFRKKWRCEHRDHFFLSPTPDIPSRSPDSKWPRQCTMGLFEHRGQKIVCASTHFDFLPKVRVFSARLIMGRLSNYPSDVPAFVMGDFNADPSCESHAVFTGGLEQTGEKNGKDLFFKSVFDPPYPGTFHGFTGEPGEEHIDWILYRGELAVKNKKVIRNKFDGRYPSDHFPLQADFAYLFPSQQF